MVRMRGEFTLPPTRPCAAWMNNWKTHLCPLPYLIPYAHKAPPNSSPSIPRKNTSALSYKASCGMKQSFHSSALSLLCILLLLLSAVPSAFFYSFDLPYFFLILFLLFLLCLFFFLFLRGFFPFYAPFLQEMAVFRSGPTSVIQARRGELQSWQKALLLSGYAGIGWGFCCCEDFSEIILELFQQFTVKGLQF